MQKDECVSNSGNIKSFIIFFENRCVENFDEKKIGKLNLKPQSNYGLDQGCVNKCKLLRSVKFGRNKKNNNKSYTDYFCGLLLDSVLTLGIWYS